MSDATTTLAELKAIFGRKVWQADKLPGFKLIVKGVHEGRQRIQFLHDDDAKSGGKKIQVQFISHEGEVYSIHIMSRAQKRKGEPKKLYVADAIDQIVLRKTAANLEGKLMILPKPLPKQFAYHYFYIAKCPDCGELRSEQLKYIVFERADDLVTGLPRREGVNVIYFYHSSKDRV